MSHRLWLGLLVPAVVGHRDPRYAAGQGPLPPRLLSAGCKSNMGDVEQRHRWAWEPGEGWEPGRLSRHTEHRLTLCLCRRPAAAPTGSAPARIASGSNPLRDGGTQRWPPLWSGLGAGCGAEGAGCSPAPHVPPVPFRLCIPAESRGSYAPLSRLLSPGGRGSPCCSPSCWHPGDPAQHPGLRPRPSGTGIGMEERMLLG